MPQKCWPTFIWISTRDAVPSPLSICHLAELDNDTLYLYGPGSLDALDRNWGNQAVQAVSAISFKFIDFDNIVPQLYKIRARFPSLVVSRDPNENIISLWTLPTILLFWENWLHPHVEKRLPQKERNTVLQKYLPTATSRDLVLLLSQICGKIMATCMYLRSHLKFPKKEHR